MTAQERTLDHYHHLMQINAASHLMRAAREVGLLDQLRRGQHTAEQLRDAMQVDSGPLELLLAGLVAIGMVEQYEDDYALSRTAHLLCQYDQDLGDQLWARVADRVRGTASRNEHDDRLASNRVAATQWIHTRSAMQAAEMLDIGGDESMTGLRILDLGCGSAVWSCAMAHRDPSSTVTAVDYPDALAAAQSTADSIELGSRFETMGGPPGQVVLPAESFDLVLLAQRISGLGTEAAQKWLDRAIAAAVPGGRVAVIDLVQSPAKPTLAETIEALRLELDTTEGHVRSIDQIQQLLNERGLQAVQFALLEASKGGLGVAIGVKP